MRFEPIYKQIKEIYDAERIGRAFFVEGSYIHDMRSLYNPVTWRSHPQDCTEHPDRGRLPSLRFTPVDGPGPDVTEVHAYSNGYATQDFPLDDCYIFTFQFETVVSAKCSLPAAAKVVGWRRFSLYLWHGGNNLEKSYPPQRWSYRRNCSRGRKCNSGNSFSLR